MWICNIFSIKFYDVSIFKIQQNLKHFDTIINIFHETKRISTGRNFVNDEIFFWSKKFILLVISSFVRLISSFFWKFWCFVLKLGFILDFLMPVITVLKCFAL